jgi:hypothetical protein
MGVSEWCNNATGVEAAWGRDGRRGMALRPRRLHSKPRYSHSRWRWGGLQKARRLGLRGVARCLLFLAAPLGAACGSHPPFSATYTLDFGTVDVGGKVTRTVDLTNASSGAVTILSIATPSDLEFTPEQPVPVTVGPGATLRVAVVFQPFTVGAKGTVLVLHTDATDLPTITVDLTGIGGTVCLHLSASALAFGSVVVNTTATQTLTLANCGDVDLSVTPSAIEGMSAALFSLTGPLPIVVKASHSFDLAVTYAPLVPSPQDAAYFVLSLTSITPSMPTTITLVGGAILSNLALTPNPLSCPNAIPAGSSIEFSLHVANQGNEQVEVSSVAVANPGTPAAFSLGRGAWTGGTLKPGDSQDVPVIFAPPSAGSYTGELDIASNDTQGLVPVQILCGTTS